MIRGDLSNCVVHLTRGATRELAAESFVSILKSRQLRGSDLDIRGGYECVCFSEAPLSALVHSLALPAEHGMRYAPFGAMVRKKWLFDMGGRPVIYQTEAEFELLHERQRFRHVRYDPARSCDYTWEREWRVQTGLLELDLREVTFVVPTRSREERFLEQHAAGIGILSWFDSEMLEFGAPRSPWHFVVLEDFGLELGYATEAKPTPAP